MTADPHLDRCVWPVLAISGSCVLFRNMSPDLPRPHPLAWMLSTKYLELLAVSFRKRHKLPGDPKEIPESRLLAELLDDTWLFNSVPATPRRRNRGQTMHILAAAQAEAEWRVRAAARVTAIMQFCGRSPKQFSGKYGMSKVGTKAFRLTRIKNQGTPIPVDVAERIANDLGFDFRWFIWPRFNCPPPRGYPAINFDGFRDSIMQNLPAIMGSEKLINDVCPPSRRRRCPTWVDPFIAAGLAVQPYARPGTKRFDWADIPRPDGIPNCTWASIGPDFAHLDVKEKPAQADSSSTPSRKGHKASKRGS